MSSPQVALRCRPSRQEFVQLAGRHSIVPVWCDLMADTLTPVGAFRRVAGDEPGFLLESVEGGERWGRYSFVGRRPLARVIASGGRTTVEGRLPLLATAVDASSAGVLDVIEAILAAYRSPDLPALPPLHGGLVGYLGYDVVREVEYLPGAPPDDLGFPDADLSLIGQLCAFDHWLQKVVLVDNVVLHDGADPAMAGAAYDASVDRLATLAADLNEPLHEPAADFPVVGEELGAARRTMSSAGYASAVDTVKAHIRAGDVFQVVLSQRFDVDLGADPFDVYRVLRVVNPSPYLYFLRTAACTVVGSSPEPMVRLRDGVVVSRPIAGTRRRGATEEEDQMLAAELAEHPKELAEHVMLVDLARNDVGRVATFGSEQIDELMTVERYSHVMHLTSQVSGRLADGLGPVDVLRATLPAGTL